MTDDIICPSCNAPNPEGTNFCGKCGASLLGKAAGKEKTDPLIGSFIGDRFLVEERLGEGGMGVVYRAEQTAIHRMVALKVLHAELTRDENLHARFHNEAAASSRLTHPNTITIYDFGKTDSESLYIAMEYIKGQSLSDKIQGSGRIDWPGALKIAAQVCGSLQDAHEHNIIHRDLKPENIMLCRRGDDGAFVKVLDFGIAKIMEDDGSDQRQALTKTGMVFGTPQYMSPEQIRGEKVDGRTDIYSMGVILYEMLTGVLPFVADRPMGFLSKHLVEEPKPFNSVNSGLGIPAEVESLVMACLAKDRDKRPENMGELAGRLNALLGLASGRAAGVVPSIAGVAKTEPIESLPKGAVVGGADRLYPGAEPPSGQSKRAALGIAALVLAVLVVGGAAWHFLGGESEPLPPLPPKVRVAEVVPAVPVSDPAPAEADASAERAKQAGPAEKPVVEKPPAHKAPNVDEKPVDKAKPGETGDQPAPVPAPEPAPEQGQGGDDKAKIQADAPCSVTGSGDTVAQAVQKKLKASESGIVKCAKEAGGGSSVFSLTVAGGSSRPTRIKSITQSAIDRCLAPILDSDFGVQEASERFGIVRFDLASPGGVVESCKIVVNLKPKEKADGNAVEPIKIGGKTTDKITNSGSTKTGLPPRTGKR